MSPEVTDLKIRVSAEDNFAPRPVTVWFLFCVMVGGAVTYALLRWHPR